MVTNCFVWALFLFRFTRTHTREKGLIKSDAANTQKSRIQTAAKRNILLVQWTLLDWLHSVALSGEPRGLEAKTTESVQPIASRLLPPLSP